MILKNLFRIIGDYKFSTIIVLFFELLYLIKDYKGNRFNFSNNDLMTDNIPCPYYLLFKIKKNIKNNNFFKFLDLGCGSGRVIDFFNKNFPNKNLTGIEYFPAQYEYCRKIFQKQKNIKIIQADFTKSDFLETPWSLDIPMVNVLAETKTFQLWGYFSGKHERVRIGESFSLDHSKINITSDYSQ